MIFNTTYHNSDDVEFMNDLVGRPFSMLKALRIRGVGSKRMIIEEVSVNMQQYLNTTADINYANIELRPGGILIRINKGLQTFTWAIPYYQLVIYKSDGSSIHAQGRFIRFSRNQFFKENKKFFDKLLDLKVKYDFEFRSPTMSI
ncbi:MAG: hypothetical protein QNJ57_07530 [Flavobacteriaceae bacterium]|nr:hypothetical protein [Flavobacteriaceae bacterium]